MKPVDLYLTKFTHDISDRSIRSATLMQGPGDFFGFVCTDAVRMIVRDLMPMVQITTGRQR